MELTARNGYAQTGDTMHEQNKIYTGRSPESTLGVEHLGLISQPGRGKTTSFCIGILQRLDLSSEQARNTPQALILVPSQHLVEHTAGILRELGRWMEGLRVHAVQSTDAFEITNDKTRFSQRYAATVIVGRPIMVWHEMI
ncbi:ATP-dependent RNA helicase DBP5 [Penicillium herquei]|nr:ATP-dependent RNA helicase DBP5 [Penicillium herquei]